MSVPLSSLFDVSKNIQAVMLQCKKKKKKNTVTDQSILQKPK